MPYGKTLELGFQDWEENNFFLVDLQTRVDSSQVGFLNIRERSQNIYKPWVLFQ
jgi:hypothetical protein